MTAVDTSKNVSPWTVDSGTAVINRNLKETTTKSNAQIDMSGFLRLMTTQLQHQDPFAPMDNNQMVAQMAQFSSLSNQAESNKLLNSISDGVSGGRLSDAANWIGKSMLVKSNIATPDRTGAYAGELTLTKDSTGVTVDLVDGAGQVVKTLDLGAQKAGPVSFFWDGENEAGDFVGGGAYEVRVRGATTSQVATWASIAAIQSPASGSDAKLMTPLGNFTPADALRLG